jgi:transposase
MSRKPKNSIEEKIKACTDYLSGIKSANAIAAELNLGKQGRGTVRLWAKNYQKYGAEFFSTKSNSASYTKEFKKKVMEDYFAGKSSFNELCIKYNISSTATIRNWIKLYNSHMEIMLNV